MAVRINLKSIVVMVVALTSMSGFAAAETMDCAVSDPPDMLHDVVVTIDGLAATVAYSYPGMRQDVWYGPFTGLSQSNEGYRVFSFEDGTVISLSGPAKLGRSLGHVTFGLDGRQAEIDCNAPY